jgi:hypothetical protein
VYFAFKNDWITFNYQIQTMIFKRPNLFQLLPTLLLFVSACAGTRHSARQTDPLQQILAEFKHDSIGSKILKNKDLYELQIIYTQINRDTAGRPSFIAYRFNVDSSRYFYPASMVKLPLALLALEKINNLRRSGYPRLKKETFYRLDSLRAFQQNYSTDARAPGKKPSIAHDIRQILVVSDNLAYNHLFEFLGRDGINQALADKGYTHTGIVHRFNFPGRDNRYSSPVTFYDPTLGIFKQGEKFEEHIWQNPQRDTRKGKGYMLGDSLVRQPFDFKTKNWFALTDMDRMLRTVLFPEAVPEQQRFNLTKDDYRFVRHYMGIFPRECDYPAYDSMYYDGYAKYFLFGDTKARQNGSIRIFNKIGQAYGTLTDVAYVVDFERNIEFMLSATLLCNADGIFNDDVYDYELGITFLAKLARAVHAYELKRPRPGAVTLTPWREVVDEKQ